jgi:TRAP-type mannitol/chloroaromatic compound transport system permease small subunit
VKLSMFVTFILIGSTVFSFTFNAAEGHHFVEQRFAQLPGGTLAFLVVVNLLVFFLGFVIDFFEIAFIIVPLLPPTAEKVGIDLIWFGIILAINLQTSFLTPPFGFVLFYLRSLAARNEYVDALTGNRVRGVSTEKIYKGAMPFIAIQLLVLAAVILHPPLVTSRLDRVPAIDLDSIRIDLPPPDDDAPDDGAPDDAIAGLPARPADREVARPRRIRRPPSGAPSSAKRPIRCRAAADCRRPGGTGRAGPARPAERVLSRIESAARSARLRCAAAAALRIKEFPMQALLPLSRAIDWLNEKIGRAVLWLVLVAVLISAANAVVRKVFNVSSNAYLEVQWYLFSAIFLLCAGYVLKRNEHVRIDVLTGHLSKRGRTWIDIIGLTLFLLPVTLLIVWLGWPLFYRAYESGEMSQNAGGLIRWPVYLLLPVGFALLTLQGVSELIKRIAFLQGLIDDPTRRAGEKSAEEELAEAIRAQAERDLAEEAVRIGTADGDRK